MSYPGLTKGGIYVLAYCISRLSNMYFSIPKHYCISSFFEATKMSYPSLIVLTTIYSILDYATCIQFSISYWSELGVTERYFSNFHRMQGSQEMFQVPRFQETNWHLVVPARNSFLYPLYQHSSVSVTCKHLHLQTLTDRARWFQLFEECPQFQGWKVVRYKEGILFKRLQIEVLWHFLTCSK